MRMRATQHATQKQTLRINYLMIALSSIALGSAVTFIVAIAFNTLGTDSLASESKGKYPFDVSESALRKVNFTVLPSEINSAYAEVRPFISRNGTELFFSRRNHPGNVHGELDDQDIWVSVMTEDGTWGKPMNLGAGVNSKKADAICSVSPDGSEIILFNENIDPSKILMRAKLTENGWSSPQPMQIEDFYNFNAYLDFYYSFEANVLLMAVGRNDSRGEQDLYVSFPAGENKWSAPVNLGPVVNSRQSDFAPFLAADGRTLYFASYGHNGFGGCDIFQTTRLDDTWKNWSKPVNLGEGINSAREESYFSISGDYEYIYFESYDRSREVRDIFRADLPEMVKPGMLYTPLSRND